MTQTMLYSLMVAPHLTWVIGASNDDETTCFLVLTAPGVIRYTDGGGADSLPALVPALNGSDKVFDRTEAVWVGYTIRASNVLSICREVDFPAVDGDVAPLCRIDRHTIHPYQPGGFGSGGSGDEGGTGSGDGTTTQAVRGAGTGNVSLATGGAFYDGTSVVLGPGIWHVVSYAEVEGGSGITLEGRLSTASGGGGTVYSRAKQTLPADTGEGEIKVVSMVPVPSGTITLYLSVSSDTGGGTMHGLDTRILAIRVGDYSVVSGDQVWMTQAGGDFGIGVNTFNDLVTSVLGETIGAPGFADDDFSAGPEHACLTGTLADQIMWTINGTDAGPEIVRQNPITRTVIDRLTGNSMSNPLDILVVPDTTPAVWVLNDDGTVSRFDQSDGSPLSQLTDSHITGMGLMALVDGKVWMLNQTYHDDTTFDLTSYNYDGTYVASWSINPFSIGETFGIVGILQVGDEVWFPQPFNFNTQSIARYSTDGTTFLSYIDLPDLFFVSGLGIVDDEVWIAGEDEPGGCFPPPPFVVIRAYTFAGSFIRSMFPEGLGFPRSIIEFTVPEVP